MKKAMTKRIYTAREKDSTKAFSTFDKALAYVSPLNYKAGVCIRFQMEDEKMYDQLMDECLGNMWVDRSTYEQWREDKLAEYGITEDDLSMHTEVLFIEEVEVE